ncbi:MAG: superfamily phosphohydrolase [Candidatus Eremiobacteraeota bacterium]|nr:superfamily phosphohydrolase [Candidatus Eremiobacteraeota bacterium]
MRPRTQKSVRIQDSIHGIIELSALETYVVDSLAFQRLLNVKQLGMAYAVFPGADYSRFSHCIGVCHQMGRWLDTLQRNGNGVDEPKRRLYRLAALLHDVGHYPFSHTLEHAVKDHYELEAERRGALEADYYDHEDIGARIVEADPELGAALVEIGLNRETLKNIFGHNDITRLSPLLSSDLDADRVDYLRRTAHHTGLPYGLDDIQYLTTEIRLDDQGRPCWTERALHALDHLLLARFFDYQQIVFNKTVAGLELALARIIREMLRIGGGDVGLDLSKSGIDAMLPDRWVDWDDHALFEHIKRFRDNCGDVVYQRLCNSLLKRNPPRMVFEAQFIGSSQDRQRFKAWANALESSLSTWAAHFEMDPRSWFLWRKAFSWTDYELDVEVSDQDSELPELSKLPRVLRNGDETSIPLVCHQSSVIRSLYLQRAYSVRVYVDLTTENEFKQRKTICDYVLAKANAMKDDYLVRSVQTTIFDAMTA